MDLLTFKEACAFMNVSRNSLYDLIHTAEFPHIQYKPGGKFFFERKDIESWIDLHRSPVPVSIKINKIKSIRR